MRPYDFVFAVSERVLIYNGKVMKFTDEQIDNYVKNGLTKDDVKIGAYHYLMSSDDFLAFTTPEYCRIPN